jgi:hypothetical protein
MKNETHAGFDIPAKDRPDWTYWLALPSWTVHEATVLSVGLDPKRYDFDRGLVNASEELSDSWCIFDLVGELDKRLEIFSRWSHVPSAQGGLWDSSNGHERAISPKQFVALCSRIRLRTPPEIADIGADPQSRPRWPWGDYETELLQVLAEAVTQWWSTYDPDDPDTAPRKQDVVKWLKTRLDRKDSATLAGYIATIIRADDAPTGRPAKPRS